MIKTQVDMKETAHWHTLFHPVCKYLKSSPISLSTFILHRINNGTDYATGRLDVANIVNDTPALISAGPGARALTP